MSDKNRWRQHTRLTLTGTAQMHARTTLIHSSNINPVYLQKMFGSLDKWLQFLIKISKLLVSFVLLDS